MSDTLYPFGFFQGPLPPDFWASLESEEAEALRRSDAFREAYLATLPPCDAAQVDMIDEFAVTICYRTDGGAIDHIGAAEPLRPGVIAALESGDMRALKPALCAAGRAIDDAWKAEEL